MYSLTASFSDKYFWPSESVAGFILVYPPCVSIFLFSVLGGSPGCLIAYQGRQVADTSDVQLKIHGNTGLTGIMGPGSHDSSMARTDLNTLILEIIPERTTEPNLGFVQGQQTRFRLRSSPDPVSSEYWQRMRMVGFARAISDPTLPWHQDWATKHTKDCGNCCSLIRC